MITQCLTFILFCPRCCIWLGLCSFEISCHRITEGILLYFL
uniref:Uncharacterized protein n=1 Tax=Anguilla anguilla TaxID=7936 RepID=A0A0E9RG31_ANGAN